MLCSLCIELNKVTLLGYESVVRNYGPFNILRYDVRIPNSGLAIVLFCARKWWVVSILGDYIVWLYSLGWWCGIIFNLVRWDRYVYLKFHLVTIMCQYAVSHCVHSWYFTANAMLQHGFLHYKHLPYPTPQSVVFWNSPRLHLMFATG